MENLPGAESEEQLDWSQRSAWQGGSEGPSRSHHDRYAYTPMASGTQPALPVDQSESRRLVMKRKVLRHRPDGTVEVSDESPNTMPGSLGHSRTSISKGRPQTSSSTLENYQHYNDDDDDVWSREDRPRSRRDFDSDTISEYSMSERLPMNYIAARAEKVKRTDPVAKHNKYRQDWQRYSIPGQDGHQSLRWAMRMQMLESELPQRPQRRIVPNTYVAPTMNKRDSLRFSVRWDLAHHLMPRRNTLS